MAPRSGGGGERGAVGLDPVAGTAVLAPAEPGAHGADADAQHQHQPQHDLVDQHGLRREALEEVGIDGGREDHQAHERAEGSFQPEATTGVWLAVVAWVVREPVPCAAGAVTQGEHNGSLLGVGTSGLLA